MGGGPPFSSSHLATIFFIVFDLNRARVRVRTEVKVRVRIRTHVQGTEDGEWEMRWRTDSCSSKSEQSSTSDQTKKPTYRPSLTHMQTPPLNIPGDDLPIHPHSLREQMLKQLFIFLRGPYSGFLNGAVEFMSGVVGSCLFRRG